MAFRVSRSLLPALALVGACATDFTDPDPAAAPLVRITHHGMQVTHSNPEKDLDPKVMCPGGYTLRGDVFAIRGGFPAIFDVEVVDRWGVQATEVVVFGGTITDVDEQTEVRSGVQDRQNVEIARRTFPAMGSFGVKTMTFGVIPLLGSHDAGPNTVKIMASAIDRTGHEARTSDPVIGTAETLCGPPL